MTEPRTRTPSDVKWLANELAALAGELERIDEQMARLGKRRARILAVRAAMGHVALQLVAPAEASAPASSALRAPPVRANEAYGQRGALANLLRGALKGAYPRAIDARTLSDLVIAHFGLTFPSSKERYRFAHNCVGRALGRLLSQGEIERVSVPALLGNLPTVWRWRSATPSLAKLRELVAIEAEG